ncbi:uncharacterized protein LOC117563122 [Gymnodraco acuticeps]|uniref:Tektin n=1 Tax=Gymnodraco acuticeps TaxID=8218 RepID=A0A6P8WD87_GYMAC|nr:uncharacterized protein LOC117563122 [Gymnodraco acuticeps]
MWHHRALEDQMRSEVRLSLPVLSSNRNLVSHRPQLQRNRLLKLGEETICSLGDDISRIPSATRSTMRHLSSRHTEVSQWRSQISESIARVDREITAVEQMKDLAEGVLQEKQVYSQLMRDCVSISNSLGSVGQRQDRVLSELKNEEQLTGEFRETLQRQICFLLEKRGSLKGIRAQLLADFRDKGEAIKLTTKCIVPDVNALRSSFPATHYKPNYVSYDNWLSHCRELRQAADNLINDSSSFRGNLRFTLANLKNTQERQRRCTVDTQRKKINDLTRAQDTLIWERQQIRDEISDLTTDCHKVACQIQNCDSKLHRATHCLDILHQRPRRELCLDQPLFSLTLEKRDLESLAAGLCPIMRRSQRDLEVAHSHLMILEYKLAKNVSHMEVEQRCQKLHQSFLPALDTSVILTNKPRFSPDSSSLLSYLQ